MKIITWECGLWWVNNWSFIKSSKSLTTACGRISGMFLIQRSILTHFTDVNLCYIVILNQDFTVHLVLSFSSISSHSFHVKGWKVRHKHIQPGLTFVSKLFRCFSLNNLLTVCIILLVFVSLALQTFQFQFFLQTAAIHLILFYFQ